MDALVTEKVKMYLKNTLFLRAEDLPSITFKMRQVARMAGHQLNSRFAGIGLGAGPESRVAAAIVERAIVGGHGNPTEEHQIRICCEKWVRETGVKWA